MTNPSEERPLAKLIKLLNMTTSSNDGEVANAMRLANRILANDLKADWEKLLRGRVTVVEDPFAAQPRTNGHTAPSPKAPPPTPGRRKAPARAPIPAWDPTAPDFDPHDPAFRGGFTSAAGWSHLSTSMPQNPLHTPPSAPQPPISQLSHVDLIAEAKTYTATPKQQRWIDDIDARLGAHHGPMPHQLPSRDRDFLESFVARARRNQGATPNVNIF